MSSIKLKHSSGNSMSIGAPATNPASDLELKLPATVGTAGQALVNSSTAGTLEFATVVKSGDGKSTNTTSMVNDVGYSFENTNTTSGFGMKIKGGGTDTDRYIVRFDDAAGNERARINANGKVGVGTATPSHTLHVYGASGDDVSTFQTPTTGNSNVGMIVFKDGGDSYCGQITSNPNSHTTSFVTNSDYRLKENEVAITDGITRVKQFKPYRFDWKKSGKTVDGFFAHEAQTVVPESIIGTKDETEDILYVAKDTIPEGKSVGDIKETVPKYQGIDQSKLVPLLTAALQEAITKIEPLETKVAALEAHTHE